MTLTRNSVPCALYAARRALCGRTMWAIALAISLSAVIVFLSREIRVVTIRDGGATTQHYTTSKSAEQILAQNGYELGADDEMRFDGFSGKVGVIDIKRAFPVSITADGQTREIMTTAAPLSELLEEEGITLGEFDILTCAAGEYVQSETDITIQRVELETTVVTEDIPYETVTRSNSLLRNGRTRTLIAGSTGERVLTYIDRVVDGVLQERELVKTVVTRESETQYVLVGSDDAVSPLDFGIALDANGVPTSYKYVLTGQICTGYSGRGKKVHGASGMDLSAGYVAVRASQIPYGTRLYIASADNSFIYGFAIAADTGVGLINGTIDIDLFYDTYEESRLNGRKICNVYVLD